MVENILKHKESEGVVGISFGAELAEYNQNANHINGVKKVANDSVKSEGNERCVLCRKVLLEHGANIQKQGNSQCLADIYHKCCTTTHEERNAIMEVEKHIIKPYTMNGGGFRYIGQDKVPTICAMYHNVFSTFPEKPYIMEISKTGICVAMRGRISENQPVRTVGTHLKQTLGVNTQSKVSCLISKRTECDKQIRKQCENIVGRRYRVRRLTPQGMRKTPINPRLV